MVPLAVNTLGRMWTGAFVGVIAAPSTHHFAFAFTCRVAKLQTVEALLRLLDERSDSDFQPANVDFIRDVGQPECEEIGVCEFFRLTTSS